jgi:predicted ribosome quality control (RQC) complex YloA/Tae2 family protein
MQQETRSGQKHFAIDNLTYDLMTVISEKSKGLEAFDQYLQDAQSNQQVSQLFQQIRQQDQQAIQQLMQQLQQAMSSSRVGASS